MAWIGQLAAVALLLAAAATTATAQTCPTFNNATCKMSGPQHDVLDQCIQDFFFSPNAIKAFKQMSGRSEWNMGNTYLCANPLAPKAHDVTMHTCFIEYELNAEPTLKLGQGVCLPASCNNDAVGQLGYILMSCRPVVDAFMAQCVLPAAVIACNMSHNASSCMRKFETAIAEVDGVFEFATNVTAIIPHCGDVSFSSMDAGAVIMAILIALLLSLSVAAYVIERSRRLAKLARERTAATQNINSDDGDVPLISAISLDGNAQGEARPKRDSKLITFILWFSPGGNIEGLVKKEPARSISCLDALRTISMALIVLGHTANFYLEGYASNELVLLESAGELSWAFVAVAIFCVDTFFFISGMLTVYSLLRRAAKVGNNIPVVKFTVLRFLRLLPLVAVVVGFYANLTKYTNHGILWYRMVQLTDLCTTSWWSNLLFINNFYPTDYMHQCLPWAWFLAVDMQLFIVTLILLVVYLKNRKVGLGLAFALIIFSVALAWGLDVHYDMTLSNSGERAQNMIYDKPYTRMGAYMVGALVGFLLTAFKPAQLKINWLLSYFLLFAASTVLVTIAFSFYWNSHAPGPFGVTFTGFYYSLLRVIWAGCIAVIAVLCSTGQGGFFTDFLGLQVWEPLGKLTFGAYLSHPIIIRTIFYGSDDLQTFNPANFVQHYFAFIFAAYLIATILYVLVEAPAAHLLEAITKKGGKK